MQPSAPPQDQARDLVLVGGGHAHVGVLRSLRERPEPGTRATLVSRDGRTAYSGMLPGLIAGYYRPDEAHIDLPRLAAACGVRLIVAEAAGIDIAGQQLLLRDGPPVSYDVLSLDTGSTPALTTPGAREHALPVKPVDAFLAGLDALIARARSEGRPPRLAIVGGGAGGVETALSIADRLRREMAGHASCLTLLTRSVLVPELNAGARRHLRAALGRAGIAVIEGAEVVRVEADRVICADGREVPCDRALWATWAGAPAWLGETGLPLDERGFVAVEPTLRSVGDERVFAAGDVASVIAHPRPKAGVYAVRQGPPLAANLRRALRGEPLEPFTPQRGALVIVGTGEGRAVAARGPFAFEGRLAWRLKEAIDRRWMRDYQDLPPLPTGDPA